MAVIAASFPTKPATVDYDGVSLVQWTPLTFTGGVGDSGAPIELPNYSDRSVQVTGTFGGGTIVIEGSIDGTNYVTLTDPSSTALSKTSAFIEGILELVRFIRPRVTAGDGTTSLTCTMIFKK
jgi:hypothetical protein